jgi:hypothetical protein
MKHPDDSRLSLIAGGDAGFCESWMLRRHLRQCAPCRETVEAFRRLRADMRGEFSRMPAGLDWNRLAEEMRANIHVGLVAGECVAEAKPRGMVRPPWKPALAAAALLMVLISSFWMTFPTDQKLVLSQRLAHLWSPRPPAGDIGGVYLEADRNGIQVKGNGATLTMMHAGSEPAVVSVSAQGSLRARYIDDDTGQVTITNVYAQ